MVRLSAPRTTPAQRDERGAVAIVVALLMTVLAVCAALVIDLGQARDTRRESQNASDASALAAAVRLYPKSGVCTTGTVPCFADAVSTVKDYANINFGVATTAWTGCTNASPLTHVVSGESNCISFDSASSPSKVLVQMPTRTVRTQFAGVIGRATVPVSSKARAVIAKEMKCSLCFLGDVDAGNADFTVLGGGSTAVNGSITAGPNSYWTATNNYVVGSTTGGVFSPAVSTISSFTDPLASMSLPLSTSALTAKTNPCTQGPGIYATAFEFPNDASCTLSPGLYAVRNTWSMKNNTVVTATGVTLYGQSPAGYLDFKNGVIKLTAPTTGTYKDLAVIYDRDNTNPLSLLGNGNSFISGTVYALNGKLDFNGNSCFQFIGGPIVVNGVIKANGNTACIDVNAPKDITFDVSNPGLDQ